MSYKREIDILKEANLFRERFIYDDEIKDLASNDYLNLASKKSSLKKTYKYIKGYSYFAPKASQLINGYHQVHQEFEEKVAKLNNFESAIVVGSGFLANCGVIEALIRRDDFLLIDEEYHASGMVATKMLDKRFSLFKHNSVEDLKDKLSKIDAKRVVVAIEGVYSMSGELAKREFFELAKERGFYLLIDEAHSNGVIGDRLLGILDYYNIDISDNFIKIGTLGKAYGSYGAYILSSKVIRDFLINRSKPIIYSTAPSIFDIALALINIEYINQNLEKLKRKLNKRRKAVKKIFKKEISSQIFTLEIGDNK
ncbi:MAG: pyridoxal phosphate-dependent aminotransferase family protein, partial [Epsilonproteobacteria bacterium]|nr:pyridoxal phosphate-dependent aminotransferase family protein [Campylobacterota bacterium]